MSKRISLTQNQFTIVDDADYDWLSQFKWCYQASKPGKPGYAVRGLTVSGKFIQVRMHRVIVQAEEGVMVDHRDGDGLNNTRLNIRVCTRTQNQQNQSGKLNRIGRYKGVYLFQGKHRARICVNKKEIYLGGFATPEDAAHAYDAAAQLHFGEFAYLNFPQEQQP